MSAVDTLPSTPDRWVWSDRWLRAQVLRRLARLRHGGVEVREALGVTYAGEAGGELQCRLDVHDPGFYRLLASGGSVGAGEAYSIGLWDCDDLTRLVQLLARNIELLDGLEGGLASVAGVARRAWHHWNRNSVVGSRRNIRAHYDLGNDLFEAFLDRRMQYSCAIFERGDETLDEAQETKLARIAARLELKPGDRLVEIGSGWGGLAEYAAARHGCAVTTTTISERQYEAARRRVHEAGLADRVTVLMQDYRRLEGRFDKLVSVEMVEAVGHRYLDGYFRKCYELLRPGGRMLLQSITIDDARYERALGSVDFIQRFIFPGSFIPCVSVLTGSAAAAGLRLTGLEDIGPDYARTLQCWDQRFRDASAQLDALGYDRRFRRLWQFYFAYCRGGFLARQISDVHMVFSR